MIRISHILMYFLLIISCDKSIIDPVHSNPFDKENEETFGDPFQLRAKNYPDKIRIEWNDIAAESNLQIAGYRLIRKSFSTNDTNLISSSTMCDYDDSKYCHDDDSEYLQWDSTYTYKLAAVLETQNEFSISDEKTIQVTRKIIVGKDSLDLNIDYYFISDVLVEIDDYYDNNPDSLNLVFDIHVQDTTYFENNITIKTPVKLTCEVEKPCIIDGNNEQVIFIEELGNSSLSLDTSNVIISGFTIQNGGGINEGGGIKISGASPQFINCDFKDNIAGEYGGGVYIEDASPVFANCRFTNNTAMGKGGAGYILNSGVEFINCEFTLNKAIATGDENDGGALYINNQADNNIFISDCIFDANTARLGSAIYSTNNQLSVIQYSLFTSNTSNCDLGVCGTVFFNGESESTIMSNVTFADNQLNYKSSEYSAASIYADNSTISVVNAILWNGLQDGSSYISEIMGNIDIKYSNIYDDTLWIGEGNKNNDPLFIDPENGDYTLQEDSPCIDAGTADINMNGSDDIETYNGTAPDMGRYESNY